MISSATTYDAILLVSFGGPEGMDDVIPFLENVIANPVFRGGQATTTLIEWWGLLHAIRGVLGAAATLLYLWALI